ncbi:SGNH/GDSL hydrolase family protein [Hymenobacter rubripertinctus]|uniref:SGNH/GDSL hydrolase family protein n=1 Tax=Hymenobacter rubripertinctus TaxID=2029981 RepID=A0A418R343_9BACT|nr:SGNH/GDSL hydrolase family protein [Hymenobacter rubripertinctus]RIY11806.1 SGNH/GDSL hydrolase family protein [Hymenobacter rubripertinctus]
MRLLLYLSFLLLGVGCGSGGSDPAPAALPTTPSGPAPAAIRFLSLGDSYTIGQRVPTAARWGVQLAHLAPGLQTPDIIAQTGWTTAELQQAIRLANPPASYELVSLMIGVNNQFRGLPLATYRTEFRDLLYTSIRLAGNRPGRVFVLSIPDWGRSPYAQRYDQARISQQIDQFNAVAQQESQQAGVAFLDITDLTRTADPTQFAPDGLHYSGSQMRQWASRALPVVQALLQ